MSGTTWPEARSLALSAASPLPAVELPVSDAAGCVLAAPLWSLAALPAFDTAAMDGWAVRGPGPWRVVGRVLAGSVAAAPLTDGEAVEVATGAAVPDGTDAVLPYEYGVLADGSLVGEVTPGRHVRRTGEECAARTTVLPAGAVLTPAALGLAAAVGHDVLLVHPRPRVHCLVTGDELLASGLPGDGRIRDAVGPLLPGAVGASGGRLVGLDRLGDDPDVLRKAVLGADAEVIVTTGASSVGRADFLPVVLTALAADVLVDGVQVKPGHPQVLARLTDGRLLVGLPGNPLAAMAGVVTLLGPLLAGLGGRPMPALSSGVLTDPVSAAAGSHRLVPVAVREGVARPTGHAGAAMLRGAAEADAFAVVPPGADLRAGARVDLVPLP
jgi:molybdopterin molybdotransferase